MKKFFAFAASLIFLGAAAQVDDAKLLDFAAKNYMQLLQSTPEKQLMEFGIGTKEDLKELRFMQVYPEYNLKDSKLVLSQNYRVVTVNKKGEICGLLTISNFNNQLAVADFGAGKLANELHAKSLALHLKKSAIYRDYVSQCDYIFDTSSGNEKALYHKLFDKKTVKYSEIIQPKK